MEKGKEPQRKDAEKIGAVMVVGGGVGGMQAALDLANSGFKVYLVEESSAIGGRMAQLDKTFPTNDCSMCTISPKLVETGRHLNIELLMDSEVVKVDGEAGNFTVTVRRKPRYIDVNKCNGCGECAQVCPVVIPSRFDQSMSQEKAAYRLYPQAVPNAYAIEKLGVAPCRDACPAGQRAQGYIALIREGRYDDAMRVIKEDNPFPGICGRICNHRCEEACNRNLVDQPLAIASLKRFVADRVYAQPYLPVDPLPYKFEEKVAIIGAGPCGLTAAKDLRKLGYPVTLFEALPLAGGMLRVGIPDYRLPPLVVDREVREIIDLGIDLRLNTPVTDLDELMKEDFKSVLIAVGAHEGRKLPIPGANLPEVLINTQFLRDVSLWNLGIRNETATTYGRPGGSPLQSHGGDGKDGGAQAATPNPQSAIRNRHVLVLGGGNVAMDCGRTALRLGAAKVEMACLESREKMPASREEIHEAEEEGINVYPSRSFKRILDRDGHVAGVEAVKVTYMEFDREGRLNLQTEEGSEHVLPCEVVIFAIGQQAGLAFIPESAGVGVTRMSTIAVNPNTYAATRPGVFAAGDATTGTAYVIEAVAAGHKAAASMHRYLRGEEIEPAPRPELPVVKMAKEEVQERVAKGEVNVTPRVKMAASPAGHRVSSFTEVSLGYTEEEAKAEASRCLACGICSECLSCYYKCGLNAINHDMVETQEEVRVGSVILAPGYEVYNARLSQEYGLGRYPNVLNALQFERILSASGPTLGHVQRPSDKKVPKKIAFLQCVGSRDQSHPYCSAVCCMYATKEAIIVKEHEKEVEPTIFFIDIRAYGKGFDAYYERAKKEYGVRYVRCAISRVAEDPRTKNLLITYLDEGGEIREEEFDLVVLSVGMVPSASTKELAKNVGIELDAYGFAKTDPLTPLATTRPGVYVCGVFQGPKDIPETVAQASGAAAAASEILSEVRGTLVTRKEYPAQKEVKEEEPRIGVFVCRCGNNIGGVIDVPAVKEYAASLGAVVFADENLYTCSQDTQEKLKKAIEEHKLNRVIVASCSPRTHEPLFQETIREAGLNRYLFEMANIRDQCSWVHMNDKEDATSKARDLVRMAIANARLIQPLEELTKGVIKRGLVIGGGLSGMTAALGLAEQGFEAVLVEKENELGGNLRRLKTTLDGKDVSRYLEDLTARVTRHPRIQVFPDAVITDFSGYVGNYKTALKVGSDGKGREVEIEHGVTIVATGGEELKPKEYLYGEDKRVLTQMEMEALLHGDGKKIGELKEVVMIQCVGSRNEERPYCSRVCCAEAVKNALTLKALNPKAGVTILYRDMRMYGTLEEDYTRARKAGIRFLRYEEDRKPEVTQKEGRVQVTFYNPVLRENLTFQPDLLVLSAATIPTDTAKLASMLKVPRTAEGFFLEAHMKLRPVDFASEGLFLCGIAHAPKTIEESLCQASAAVARACTVLAKDQIQISGVVSVVDADKCAACLTCVRVCPYNVPVINKEGVAEIEAAMCHGCGICASECPGKAIHLQHFTDEQVMAKCDVIVEVLSDVFKGERV
ncbi:MAG: FAD-dependent oxidoreductase [Deltaproteobacteria bacterium]|nr:FAD-dependent oxidoreductase [Deltaproteobacteria bacterium]